MQELEKHQRHLFERVNLPVEQALIDGINNYWQEANRSDPNKILIIGADEKLTIARGMQGLWPKAEIVVVERDGDLVRNIQNPPDKVQLLHAEFPSEESEGLEGPFDLIIAKHLLPLFIGQSQEPKRRFGQGVMGQLTEGGVFVASVPFGFSHLTEYSFKGTLPLKEEKQIRLGGLRGLAYIIHKFPEQVILH